MSRDNSLVRNTLYSALYSASNGLLVVLVIVVARIIGDKSFGEFSFALAIASIFEMVVDAGLITLTTRDVSRDKSLAGIYLPNILGWKLVLSAISMVLMVLAVNLLGQTSEARLATYIMGGAIVLRSYKSTAVSFLQANERFDLMLLAILVERAGILVSGVIVLFLTRNLISFVIVFALIRIPDTIFGYWLVHRTITAVRIGLSKPIVKRLQLSAIPFGTYAIVSILYAYIGTIVLSVFRSPDQVGLYNAACRIYEGILMIPALLVAVLLPRLSRLFAEDQGQHRLLSLRAVRYLSLCTLPIAITVGILAPQIIRLLFGQDYMRSVLMLRILACASVPMFINAIMNTVLISSGMEKQALKIYTAGLAVMTVSNVILVRQFGAVGAASSVALSEISMFTILAITVNRVLFRLPIHRIAWKPALSCVPALGIIYLLLPTDKSVIAASSFLAVYLFLLLMLRAFDAKDLSNVKALFSIRPSGK